LTGTQQRLLWHATVEEIKELTMPNCKSAEKRLRLSIKCEVRNRSVKSEIATCARKLGEALEGREKDKAQGLYRTYCSVLDSAVKRGVIKINTAGRRKSRVHSKVFAL
jgi:small subunit ribosomal protein S20